MAKDSGTRSGLLWEVERILDECSGELPQVLLMENVPQVIGKNNIDDFQQWIVKLETLGYQNYCELLNAKDFGIPQNRERCFMVSLLGEYLYTFPKPQTLTTKLKDILEKDVDAHYWLTSEQLQAIATSPYDQTRRTLQEGKKDIVATLSARDYKGAKCVAIKEKTKKGYKVARGGDGIYIDRPHQKRGVVQHEMIPTLKTTTDVGVIIDE